MKDKLKEIYKIIWEEYIHLPNPKDQKHAHFLDFLIRLFNN